ncbi:MAG TPA: 3-hydroxybutyryl-CoA dehydrogenase [Thermoanaerobaculia bacterium]|jgi:3-hydroxybutyryl-CoA dehydrogenase|nr:3-hydroxybutyryl-CoA dehydrogenase [Thermoanaerobaculia bacterium]
MEIGSLGVVGAGQMGSGIAHVAAAAGMPVTLVDVEEGLLAAGRLVIAKNLDREVAKGKRTAEEKASALGRLTTTTRLEALGGSDAVIEAIVENEAVKKELFGRLEPICKPGAILASNTSSISITRLAAATRRPEAFVGMHFMNPVPVMQLVEVIRGMATSDATAAAVDALARRMGKTPIFCNDSPGFVSNRVLMPMINEAIETLREGVATREAVDGIMKLGMNHPMGPLTLADFIGLDTCLSILRVLHDGFGDPRYRPSPLLVRMVDAGWLGKKSGRGFYEYPAA